MLTDFRGLLSMAVKKGKRRFAVAGAHGDAMLKAAMTARHMGFLEPVLVGDVEIIHRLARENNLDLAGMDIYPGDNDTVVAEKAVSLIAAGHADALMKGNISTPVLLKAVLKEEYGLRTGNLLSHVAIMELPGYHKLLMITDGGMVIRPGLEEKIQIVENAAGVLKRMGWPEVKVACVSASEKVNPKLPETLDAVELAKMSNAHPFENVIIEGPMGMDMALSREAAEIKHAAGEVAGDPDIILVPDVSCGNITAKGLVYLAKAEICGAIVGARVPIALISRAERSETWVNSLALSNVLS